METSLDKKSIVWVHTYLDVSLCGCLLFRWLLFRCWLCGCGLFECRLFGCWFCLYLLERLIFLESVCSGLVLGSFRFRWTPEVAAVDDVTSSFLTSISGDIFLRSASEVFRQNLNADVALEMLGDHFWGPGDNSFESGRPRKLLLLNNKINCVEN